MFPFGPHSWNADATVLQQGHRTCLWSRSSWFRIGLLSAQYSDSRIAKLYAQLQQSRSQPHGMNRPSRFSCARRAGPMTRTRQSPHVSTWRVFRCASMLSIFSFWICLFVGLRFIACERHGRSTPVCFREARHAEIGARRETREPLSVSLTPRQTVSGWVARGENRLPSGIFWERGGGENHKSREGLI